MYNVVFSDSAYLRTRQERTLVYSGLYDIVIRSFVSFQKETMFAMHLLYYIDKCTTQMCGRHSVSDSFVLR